jgi:hypothetical protein
MRPHNTCTTETNFATLITLEKHLINLDSASQAIANQWKKENIYQFPIIPKPTTKSHIRIMLWYQSSDHFHPTHQTQLSGKQKLHIKHFFNHEQHWGSTSYKNWQNEAHLYKIPMNI